MLRSLDSRVMIEVSVSNNLTIERTSVSVDQALDNPVELSSDADKTASKSKGKSNDSKIKGSRPKKTDVCYTLYNFYILAELERC